MKDVIIKLVISGEYAEKISAMDEKERKDDEINIRGRVDDSKIYNAGWSSDCECNFLYPEDFFYSDSCCYTYFIVKKPVAAIDTIMNFMLFCYPVYFEENGCITGSFDFRVFLSYADISVELNDNRLELVSSAFENFSMFEKIACDGDIIICDSMLKELNGCGYEVLKSEQIKKGGRIVNAHKMKYLNPRTDNIPYIDDFSKFLQWDDNRLSELLKMFEAYTIGCAIKTQGALINEKFRQVIDKDKWAQIIEIQEGGMLLSTVIAESNRIMMVANMMLSGKKDVSRLVLPTMESRRLHKKLLIYFELTKRGLAFV